MGHEFWEIRPLDGFSCFAYFFFFYRWLASTQFSPIDARRAFPCWDEPSFKASFLISLVRPSNMHSMSNSPMRRSKDLGWVEYVVILNVPNISDSCQKCLAAIKWPGVLILKLCGVFYKFPPKKKNAKEINSATKCPNKYCQFRFIFICWFHTSCTKQVRQITNIITYTNNKILIK